MNKNQLPDTQQSYLQLTAIQLSSWTNLPILATSILILQENSFLGAALTIFVGNAILWFIRLGVIAMSYDKRQSTLNLAQEYLGTLGGYCIALLLLISTAVWFLIQTTAASSAITHLVVLHENPNIDQFIQVSVILGLASTLLCMEGIVFLRRLSVISFPILLLTFLIILYYVPGFPHENDKQLSFSGLSLVLATNLGITADMPTFFRHSKTWSDSIKALSSTQIVSLIVGLASIYLGSLINGVFEVNQSLLLEKGQEFLRYSLMLFIFISAVCANVANVYSASVGWELIAPRALIGRQEYLILGLGLTMLYILLTNIFSPLSMLTICDNALVNLSLVFIFAYILTQLHKNAPTVHQKIIYFLAWVLSTAINTIQLIYNPFPAVSFLLASFTIIVVIIGFSFIILRFKGQTV